MHSRRLSIATVSAAVALSLAGLGATAHADPLVDDPEIEELGAPLTTVRMTDSQVGEWSDGSEVLYATAAQATQPLEFVVFDIETGEQLDHEVIPELEGSHSTVLGPDGNVYVAGWGPQADLLRYSPETQEIENLGQPIPGETVITQLMPGEDGILYGGTFPAGKVFALDTATDEVEDLGVVAEGEQYARSLAYAPGTLYVGSEGAAVLTEIDLETGERTTIEIADGMEGSTRHYDLEYRDGLLFSYVSPSLSWHVYDTETGEWIEEIPTNAQGGMSETDEDGNVYFVKGNDGLVQYDLESREWAAVPWDTTLTTSQGAAGISLAELGSDDWPGQTVVGMGSRGELWRWNSQAEEGTVVASEAPEFAVTVRSLGLGPDGNIYVGGSTGARTLGAFDTTAEEFITDWPGGPSARIDAFDFIGDTLYFSTYGPGALNVFEPGGDYAWGTNPRELFGLYAEHHQERIWALEQYDETSLILGTIGGRAVETGMLFLYDTATDELTNLGAPIDGFTVASLAVTDEYVIGGTSVDVLGGVSPHDEAVVFLWDKETQEVVWQGAPTDGSVSISELVEGEDGRIWALTSSGNVVEFDPETREFGEPVSVGATGGSWGMGTLDFGPDGRLYGSTGSGDVFVLDPDSGETRVVADGEHATFDEEGYLYFAQDGIISRFAVDGAGEEPAPAPSEDPSQTPGDDPTDGSSDEPLRPNPGLPDTGE